MALSPDQRTSVQRALGRARRIPTQVEPSPAQVREAGRVAAQIMAERAAKQSGALMPENPTAVQTELQRRSLALRG